MFRKIIKAVGGIDAPAEEKYSYLVIQFNEDWTFKREIVKCKDTHMRVDDETKSIYEERVGAGRWVLICKEAFIKLKKDWDRLRKSARYAPINNDGDIIIKKGKK